MSEAEQAAFFSHWGSQIESSLYKGFDAIDLKLRRLEFLQDCAKPLRHARLLALLKRACTFDELGHFRLLAHIIDTHEPEPHPTLCLAGRDTSGGVFVSDNVPRQLVGIKNRAWSQGPDKTFQNTIIGLGPTTDRLEVYAALHKPSPFRTLSELDERFLSIYVTKPLFSQLSYIALIINDYVIAEAEADQLVAVDGTPLVEWPEEISEEERNVPWCRLLLRIEDPSSSPLPGLDRKGWSLAFSTFTPEKLEKTAA